MLIKYIKLVFSKNKEIDVLCTSQEIFFIMYITFWDLYSNNFINKKIIPFFTNFKADIKIQNNKYYIKKTRFNEFIKQFIKQRLCTI